MWERILAHGTAALATPRLRRYRLCMRALVFVAVFVAGCATSPFPEDLARSADRALTLRELRSDTTAHLGARVILGGEVLTTTPKPGETEIEVLSRPLRAGDVPERSDSTNGRFLVRTPEFLDPAIYAPGRRLTVLGTVAGRSERRVGDLPYAYPVISAERIKLWPKETPWVGGEYPPPPLDSPVRPYTR
jgi:outer membrane lipoprotein